MSYIRPVCAFAVVAAVLAAVPAAAEPVRMAQYFQGDFIPPFEISTIVRSMDLTPLHRPVFQRGRYVLRAVDQRNGEEVRVVVDARTGHVLSVTPVATAGLYPPVQRYEPQPRYAPQAPADDDEEFYDDDRDDLSPPPANPPRVIPGPRSSVPAPAPRSAAVTPSEPPLPRPKPEGQQTASQPPAPAPAQQGPVRQIELYKKPQDQPVPAPDARKDSGFPPVQPLDDTPSVKPNL